MNRQKNSTTRVLSGAHADAAEKANTLFGAVGKTQRKAAPVPRKQEKDPLSMLAAIAVLTHTNAGV